MNRPDTSKQRSSLGAIAALMTLATLLLATAAMAESDAGRIELDDITLEISEGSGMLVVTVERQSGEDGRVSVDYATADGSAVAGDDFESASGTLTWEDGDDAEKVFVVTILEDAEDESDEAFVIALSNVTGGAELRADRSTATVILEDNDGAGDDGNDSGGGAGVVKFDERSFEVLETAGTATIRVERSRGERGAISVEYSTEDGTAADPDDYTGVSGVLEWTDGDESARTFTIDIVADDLTEGSETVNLRLSNPTGGAALDSERSTSILVIKESMGDDNGSGDNGKAGVLKFDQRTFRAAEGIGMAVITVERSRGETGEVSVSYSTADGTATSGADYESASGILTWASGDGSPRSFVVTVLSDNEGEPDENVELMLSDPTGGATVDAVRGTSVLTIIDDDGGAGGSGDDSPRAGVLKLDERSFEVIEGDTMAVITVERSMGQRGAVTVDYTTADGSAQDGLDYQGVSGTLSWGPGDGSNRTFMVPILDDDLQEGTETVNLVLSNPTGGASLDAERGQGILEILDQDGDDSTGCAPSPGVLCFQQGRFQAEITWRGFDGTSGHGRAIEISDTSGLFWFFDDSNMEVLLKTVDACALEGFHSYWVFFAATTSVDFTLRITDTQTGLSREYTNLLGKAALPVQDTATFSCP